MKDCEGQEAVTCQENEHAATQSTTQNLLETFYSAEVQTAP